MDSSTRARLLINRSSSYYSGGTITEIINCYGNNNAEVVKILYGSSLWKAAPVYDFFAVIQANPKGGGE